MKKLLLGLATVVTVLAIPATSLAAAAKTDVSGLVTNNGKPVNGAKVTVICAGHAKKTTTDSSGSYLVQFNAKNCPVGANVSVTATKGKQGGNNDGKVNPVVIGGVTDTKLNIALINVSLPELGLVTGFGTAVLAGGSLYVIRRRSLGAKAH